MGEWRGLGLLRGHVVRFHFDASHGQTTSERPKIPHIGWNQVVARKQHPLMQNLPVDGYAYFVHSFHPVPLDPEDVIAVTNYGYDFASVVAHGNIWGIQFHPEKSQILGLQMLRNFVEV